MRQGGGIKISKLPFGSRIERKDLMGAIAPDNDHADFYPRSLLRKLHQKPSVFAWKQRHQEGNLRPSVSVEVPWRVCSLNTLNMRAAPPAAPFHDIKDAEAEALHTTAKTVTFAFFDFFFVFTNAPRICAPYIGYYD